MMKIYGFLFVFLSLTAKAEMAEMSEADLGEESGQAGITLSAKADFDDGSRISYTNADAEYLDGQDYWLVINNITGSIEIKGLKLDVINDFGPSGSEGALQWTLPEEIVFDEFKTEGLYLSSEKEVNASSRFVMAIEYDGTLQFPANTTMSIFSTQ
ncbi:DUF6160 family protein [Thalassolituus sp. LLYu03]|uniref:DUF6160 family protein n=1 Tax=Thalassolituus sp. LLYu03 TaxID=3421656 RepID=UPI003D28E714